MSRVESLPSEVYPAGKFQWLFTCGFDFRLSLLPFVAGLAVMKGLLPCLLIYLFLCVYLMSSDTFRVASCIFLCSRSTLNIIMQL